MLEPACGKGAKTKTKIRPHWQNDVDDLRFTETTQAHTRSANLKEQLKLLCFYPLLVFKRNSLNLVRGMARVVYGREGLLPEVIKRHIFTSAKNIS
jgi:hypothetical protein